MVTLSKSVFDAIADPTRRAILDALCNGERSAGDIAGLFPVSRPAISKHLRVLRGAKLVRERKVARSRIYALDPAPLSQVQQWLDHYRVFWGARLHDLRAYVESPEGRADVSRDARPGKRRPS
jgi:DNA-binding transcriptional ArsR family regulator